MIKFFKDLQLAKLMKESSNQLSVFEKISKNLELINNKLFSIKTVKQKEIDALVQECQKIHETMNKNKNVKAKMDKLLND